MLKPDLKIGLVVSPSLPWQEFYRRWALFQKMGADSLWTSDHLLRPFKHSDIYLECWALLASVAPFTTIPFGPLVSCNTFRHPALLAKQAFTLGEMSSRNSFVLGIGAGWYQEEHEILDIPFPTPGELVHGLEQSLQQVHYRPLLIAAHGWRMLRLTARHADLWNTFGTVQEVAARDSYLSIAAIDEGRDPKDIRRTFNYWDGLLKYNPWDSLEAFKQMLGEYSEVGIQEFYVDAPQLDKFWLVEEVLEYVRT